MKRRQRPYRQKQRTRLETGDSTAKTKPLQSSKRLSPRQRPDQGSKILPLPTRDKTERGAFKPTFLDPNSVKSPQKNKQQSGIRHSLKSRQASGKSQAPVALASAKKPGKKVRRRSRPSSPLLYAIRLLILGVGIAAIAGTILSAWDSATHNSAEKSSDATLQAQETASKKTQLFEFALKEELLPLKSQVEALAIKNPKLEAGAFFVDLDTGAYIDYSGTASFSAASTIKVPILVAFFQDVDAGKIRLNEELTMEKEMIGGGSGNMQFEKPGTKFTALETATRMIVISDNTATNMLIFRLGGIEALNERFRSWGLTETTIRNLLPDLPGTNTTTPKELATVMGMVNEGNLVSIVSRDRILDIMRRTVTKTLLPRGLGKGATISHKTGDIGSLVADVGLVDMPIGKRYIGAVMVQRANHNDPAAQELIRQISRTTYQYLNQPPPSPSSTPSPFPSSEPFITPVTTGNLPHP